MIGIVDEDSVGNDRKGDEKENALRIKACAEGIGNHIGGSEQKERGDSFQHGFQKKTRPGNGRALPAERSRSPNARA